MTLKGSVRVFFVRVQRYVRKNWGAPFVFGFMVLLSAAAVCLVARLDWWADEVAVYAFYSLVAGVVLQLLCFWKYSGKGEEAVAS